MFRLFSTIIIIVACYSNVFASSKQKRLRCDANEILSGCANRACDYRKCSQVGQPIECIILDRKYCKRGCICAENYLRADNGTCIPASQCPNARKCPKPNEYYDLCPPQCPSRTCGVMDNVTCPEPLQAGDPRCPQPSCRCNVGFYRDSDGNCVIWNLCKKCPENETQTQCFEGRCERRDCSDISKPVVCVRINPDFCTVGCLCIDGFLRAQNRTCIPINQCPEAQCKEDEIFDACPPTCPGEQCGVDPSTTLCSPSPQSGDPSCQPRCRCRDGYLRNNNGKCIPQTQCPKCPANEIQTQCFEGRCERRDCSDIPKPVFCVKIDPDFCTVGCLCREGFLRAQNKKCIPINQCPEAQCKEDEIFDACPPTCPGEQCGVDPSTALCSPSPQPGDPSCQPRCRCRDGYLRNNNGKCIPQSQCPKCPANEIQTQCFEGRCERRDCSDIPKPVVCVRINPDFCTVGCLCREGFLRAQNETCIPINQCPEAQCKEDEIFDACPPTCPGEQCGVDPSTALCSPSPQPGDPSCQPRCRCRDGYLRNNNGKCIPQSQCPKCPANEIQTQCFEGRCERRDCSDIPKPVVCVRINPDFCTVGCLCRNGFLRAQNGTCIPIIQCPEAQCGDNQVFDVCPPSCPGEQCGVDPTTVLCLPSPQPGDPSCQPRCRCRIGYFRNNNGKCVPQDQCSTACGLNEIYDKCIAPCPPRRCDVDESNIRCEKSPQPGDPDCIAGCRCADNFFRNNESICVTKSECFPTCGQNEVYDTCVKQCPPQICNVDPRTVLCPPNQECKPGCRCVGCHLRNNSGFCVPRNKCEKTPATQCPY